MINDKMKKDIIKIIENNIKKNDNFDQSFKYSFLKIADAIIEKLNYEMLINTMAWKINEQILEKLEKDN